MNKSYPMLPLRDVVVYPHLVIPLFVGREKSIKALQSVGEKGLLLFFTTLKSIFTIAPRKRTASITFHSLIYLLFMYINSFW